MQPGPLELPELRASCSSASCSSLLLHIVQGTFSLAVRNHSRAFLVAATPLRLEGLRAGHGKNGSQAAWHSFLRELGAFSHGLGILWSGLFLQDAAQFRSRQCSPQAELWSRENTEYFWIYAVVSKPDGHRGTNCTVNYFCHCQAHLLKKQNSGTTGVGANARVIPAPLREVVHPVWGRMVAWETTHHFSETEGSSSNLLCVISLQAAVLFHSKVGHTGLMHSFVIWDYTAQPACSPDHNLTWRMG